MWEKRRASVNVEVFKSGSISRAVQRFDLRTNKPQYLTTAQLNRCPNWNDIRFEAREKKNDQISIAMKNKARPLIRLYQLHISQMNSIRLGDGKLISNLPVVLSSATSY